MLLSSKSNYPIQITDTLLTEPHQVQGREIAGGTKREKQCDPNATGFPLKLTPLTPLAHVYGSRRTPGTLFSFKLRLPKCV